MKLSVVLISMMAIQSFTMNFDCFANSPQQDRPSTHSENQWTLSTSFGITVWIGDNSAVANGAFSGRDIYLFIEQKDFTKENLQRVFTGLAAEYDQPKYLTIQVYTDKKMVEQAIARSKLPPICFIPNPSSDWKALAKQIYGDSYEPEFGFLFARYKRSFGGDEEKFYYKRDHQKSGMIEVVLRSKPAPTYTGDKQSDLMLAARLGDTSKIDALIRQGAEVNWKDGYGETALINAIARKCVESVKSLLSHGAYVEAKNQYGQTALIEAVSNRNPEIVKLLLENHADVNAWFGEGTSALSLAAYNGQTEIVKALLEKGADAQTRKYDGTTPLMYAAANCKTEMIMALLRKGADVNARDNQRRTALMQAGDDADTVQVLLDAGADVNAKDNNGWTALMLSVLHHPAKTRVLLNNGADIRAKNNKGSTALTIVMKYRSSGLNEEVIQLLKNAGAEDQ